MLASNPDINALLKIGTPPSWLERHRRLLLWTGVAFVVIGSGGWWWVARSATTDVSYQTVAARLGSLTVTVSTTGTVEPVNQVEVGSEISGTVTSVKVDYNDAVKAGQVLAEINTDQLTDQANRAQALLDVATADVASKQALLHQAESQVNRARPLALHDYESKKDLEAAETALAQAQAGFDGAKAQVKVAEADLASNRTQLSKARIVSPINGMVLDRNIDPGQTVAASLQSPVLFTIADDLTQMHLVVDVDEADAGSVKEGQPASFTVEAFPDRHFDAKVVQLRYAPVIVSGVVTYKSVLSVDNSSLVLRPGMTVAADIVTKKLDNALVIPNAALRYAPPSPAASATGGNFLAQLTRPGRPTVQPATATDLSSDQKRVWVLRNDKPMPIMITVGSNDGNATEVVKGDLHAGDQLITSSKGEN
jgi:HlyD family secretion protein